MIYKPRHFLLIVERVKESKTVSGILLPGAELNQIMNKFKVLAVGPKVEDIKVGDIIFAEDMLQPIEFSNKDMGLLNEKYIHLIFT